MITPIHNDSRWDAIARRDPTAAFIFGVRTTRIACRPGCSARTPRPENVSYFADFAAAREAGFRACKRCAPDDVAPDGERRRLVERACRLLEADDTMALIEIAGAVGLSRFHFQRLFRTAVGVTPGEYRRAARERRLRTALTDAASVTDAIGAAGYGAASRAYESDPLGMTPSAYRAGAPGERIAYAVGDSALGRVLVARTARGICAIALGGDEPTLVTDLARSFPRAEIVRDDSGLDDNLAAVLQLIDAGGSPLSLNLDIRGTAFQRRVWNALRMIPAGERWTYAQVADAIGQRGSARAVASACAANHIAVAIPCHRVVGTDGKLRGYRWGVDRKAALLDREQHREWEEGRGRARSCADRREGK